MPRYYNPEDSDFTLWLATKIGNIFSEKLNSLSTDEIEKAIKLFRKEGNLSSISQPRLIIKKDCSRGHFMFDKENRINQYFPSYYIQQENKLIICQNFITNSVQLLENVRRESLISDFYQNYPLDQDEDFACASIKACKKGYDIYNEPQKVQKQSLLCAKLLFRHRGPNTNDVPYDAWVRLTDKVIKQKSYCYNDQFSLQ